MGYRVVDHTADLGIEIQAESVNRLFSEAALAFADCITEVGKIRDRRQRSLRVVSESLELLLVDWLSELLFVFESDGELFSGVEAEVSETDRGWQVVASAGGEEFDEVRHPLKIPIKAVTYHGLAVTRDNDQWYGRIIFDI